MASISGSNSERLTYRDFHQMSNRYSYSLSKEPEFGDCSLDAMGTDQFCVRGNLSSDTESFTGANVLYESLDYEPSRQYLIYRKPLRIRLDT